MLLQGTYHAETSKLHMWDCVTCGVPFSGGASVTRKSQHTSQWQVSARSVRGFFHFQKLCGTCLCQARQLLVNAIKRALHCLTVTGRVPSAAHPGVEAVLHLSMT